MIRKSHCLQNLIFIFPNTVGIECRIAQIFEKQESCYGRTNAYRMKSVVFYFRLALFDLAISLPDQPSSASHISTGDSRCQKRL
jgi:hypothetical protein